MVLLVLSLGDYLEVIAKLLRIIFGITIICKRSSLRMALDGVLKMLRVLVYILLLPSALPVLVILLQLLLAILALRLIYLGFRKLGRILAVLLMQKQLNANAQETRPTSSRRTNCS